MCDKVFSSGSIGFRFGYKGLCSADTKFMRQVNFQRKGKLVGCVLKEIWNGANKFDVVVAKYIWYYFVGVLL